MQISQLCRRFGLAHRSPTPSACASTILYRQMSSPTSRKVSIPHTVRTAAEPRQNRLFPVRLSHIEQANPAVRLLQLTIPPSVQEPGSLDQVDEPQEAIIVCHFKDQYAVYGQKMLTLVTDWATGALFILPWAVARRPYPVCLECRWVQYYIHTCRCPGISFTGTVRRACSGGRNCGSSPGSTGPRTLRRVSCAESAIKPCQCMALATQGRDLGQGT